MTRTSKIIAPILSYNILPSGESYGLGGSVKTDLGVVSAQASRWIFKNPRNLNSSSILAEHIKLKYETFYDASLFAWVSASFEWSRQPYFVSGSWNEIGQVFAGDLNVVLNISGWSIKPLFGIRSKTKGYLTGLPLDKATSGMFGINLTI
jgi:hypothetical protein